MPRRIMTESAFFTGRFNNTEQKSKRPKIRNAAKELERLWRLIEQPVWKKKEHDEDYENAYFSRVSYIHKSFLQNCVFKMRFGTSKEKHEKFLEEYIPQKNKDNVLNKPQLFSNVEVDDDFIKNYKAQMVGKHFKFIISPENPNVDCVALTKTLVKRIEKHTGQKLLWLAAVHTNTDHPHVHLLINGTDCEGREVDCFRGTFLTQTIRDMCRKICTDLKGPRTKEEIEAGLEGLPETDRYCTLDEEIEKIMKKNNDEYFPFFVMSTDTVIFNRLCHLEKIGFAKKKNGTKSTFLLEKEWSQNLKHAGHFSSYLEARREFLSTPNYALEFFNKDSKAVEGKIIKIYRMNYEESWNNAVVIQDKNDAKKIHYVPLYSEPSEKLLGAEVFCGRENRKVKIKVKKWAKRPKTHMEVENERSQGTYKAH